MNISTIEEISQQNSELEIIHQRIEVIDKKCQEQAKKQHTKLPAGFYLDETSLWYQNEPKGENELPTQLRICSRLEIIAVTRNQHGEDFGRLLRWYDCDGRLHTWAMPMSLLAGEGTLYISELFSKGLEIEPGKTVRQKLTVYIQSSHPEARILCTPNVGWHGDCFVLPLQTIGPEEKERIILQSVHLNGHYSSQGTLEEWQQIAKLSQGNGRLIFALSMSFASTLLTPLGIEGGGVHFKGTSSEGKSTMSYVAASIWGSRDYFLTWRATINGLEGAALDHNDTLLCLDEIGQCEPDQIGEAIYMLANGSGKVRSNALGFSKRPSKWRIFFLSNGETNLAGHLQQLGLKTRAGQEVRILDIPANTGKYGAFEYLHGYPNGDSFSKALTALTSKYYGTASICFIELFIANKAEYLQFARNKMHQFEKECLPINASGQVSRALTRFAVIAAAGEIATSMGITKWDVGEAFKAAKACFEAWLEVRGGVGLLEVEQIKTHIRRFFELSGESRFVDITEFDETSFDTYSAQTSSQRILSRAGFRENKKNKTTYYVLPEVFKTEICEGFDQKLVESVCTNEKWLLPGHDKRITQRKRLPNIDPKWVYAFSNNVIGDGEDF